MSAVSERESKVQSKLPKLTIFILVALIPMALFALQARVDLFSQPANLEQVVTSVSRATFEIKCDNEWTGAGWGLEMEGDYYLVTAAHVVEDCQKQESSKQERLLDTSIIYGKLKVVVSKLVAA